MDLKRSVLCAIKSFIGGNINLKQNILSALSSVSNEKKSSYTVGKIAHV